MTGGPNTLFTSQAPLSVAVGDGMTSVYNGFVSVCRLCGYVQLNSRGNVLYSDGVEPPKGWSSIRCFMCNDADTKPVDLTRQLSYAAAAALGGRNAAAAMCEEENARLRVSDREDADE